MTNYMYVYKAFLNKHMSFNGSHFISHVQIRGQCIACVRYWGGGGTKGMTCYYEYYVWEVHVAINLRRVCTCIQCICSRLATVTNRHCR